MKNDNNLYVQWWAAYHELGYNVLPVTGQVPLLPKWSQWNTRQMSEEDVESVLASYTKEITGLCIPLGPFGGLAIDVDMTEPEFLDEAWQLCRHSPMVKFGSKGFTAFFAYDPEVTSFKSEGLEFFAQSGQVVVPPSVHPKTGGSYIWIHGTDIVPLAELPTVWSGSGGRHVLEHLRDVGARCLRAVGSVRSGGRGGVGGSGSVLNPTGRNIKLTSMAWAKAKAFEPVGVAVMDLLRFDQIAHNPPYFSDNGEWNDRLSPSARAERMYLRAVAKVEGDAGDVVASGEDVLRAGRVLEGGIHLSHEAEEILPPEDPFDPLDPLDESEETDFNSRFRALSQQMIPLFTQGSMLGDFRTVAGVKGGVDVPALQMAGALALCSICASNVLECGNMRANNMFLALSPTGSGKSAPQNALKDILLATDVGEAYLGQGMYRSIVAGVLSDLDKNRRHAKLDILDEVAELFEKMESVTDFKQAGKIMSNLWSSATTMLPGMKVMDAKKSFAAIHNPYHVWLGFAQPSTIRMHVKPEMMRQGLGPRILWFIDSVPRGEATKMEEVYGFRDEDEAVMSAEYAVAMERLVTAADYWLSMPVEYVEDVRSESIYSKAAEVGRPLKARQLKPTKAAMNEMLRIQRESYQRAEDLGVINDPMDGRYHRRAEHIRRLAIMYWLATDGYAEALGSEDAVLAKRGDVMDVEHVIWAEQLFDAQDEMFDTFMEMTPDTLGIGLKGGQVQFAVQGDMIKWFQKQRGKRMEERYVRRQFKRAVSRRDPTGSELKNPMQAYETMRRMFISEGYVKVEHGVDQKSWLRVL